jgi:pyruvate formate lyase activating enzyme
VTSGIVADIREFTVHDGPGIRTTVFLKGCPLRCAWCHNPECISPEPQVMRTALGERTVGRVYTAERLATLLNVQADVLRMNDGGVTFSGGEPLFQHRFLECVLDRLENTHVVLDTSGFASEQTFTRLARRCDLLHFDVKLVDAEAHRRYTGVTDTEANLRAIAAAAGDLPNLIRVDLLPYNRAAGGKYAPLGMTYSPPFDQSAAVNAQVSLFSDAGIPVKVG